MNERSGVDRLVALPLKALAMRQRMEFLVDKRQEPINGGVVATAHPVEELGDVWRGGTFHDTTVALVYARVQKNGSKNLLHFHGPVSVSDTF